MMKRWLAALTLLVVLALPGYAQAGVDDFVIDRFTADYYVSRTSDGYARMVVSEEIVAVFPDFDQNHGILRAIPVRYRDYPLNIRVESVTNEAGQAHNFTTYHEDDNLVLQIGDADRYVHGRVVYNIDYHLSNVISFEELDELFWNVNGLDWRQPFGEVQARIHIPASLSASLLDNQVCYAGVEGSRDSSRCSISRGVDAGEGVVVTATAKNLSAGENLSFVLAWPKGTFSPDPWPARLAKLKWLVAGSLPAITVVEMIRRWRRYGRDPEGRGIIVPQYVPPKELSPLSADVILNERLGTDAISASIVDLARRGYIAIHEFKQKKLIGSKTDYELGRTAKTDGLAKEDQAVLDLLFGGSATAGAGINLAKEANKLYSGAQKLQSSLPKDLTAAGYFRHDPNSTRTRYYIIGGIMVFVPFFFIAWAPWLALGLIASGLIVLAFAKTMPARSLAGVAARDHLLGLKDYIKLAEAERIRYLQSPEGVKQYGDLSKDKSKIKLFEALLPYAMLFGLEKNWAKQFEHLYTQPPSWYSGSGNFSAIHLANSIGEMRGESNRAFSPPSSSGGGSGFSGGSGGGGGGGGGGGW